MLSQHSYNDYFELFFSAKYFIVNLISCKNTFGVKKGAAK